MKKNKISKNWVNKQRRDTYVKQSKVDGYRARSAYKLIEIDDKFLRISLDNNIIGTIKRSNLSKDKNEQRVDRFALEEQVDSIIISVDQKTRTLNLSIKEIEINDEKEALSKYGSSDSGASLGDILGSILKKKE